MKTEEEVKAEFPVGRLFWATKSTEVPDGSFGNMGWGISSWSGYVAWVPYKMFLVRGYKPVISGLWIRCWSFADNKEVDLWQDLFNRYELESLA